MECASFFPLAFYLFVAMIDMDNLILFRKRSCLNVSIIFFNFVTNFKAAFIRVVILWQSIDYDNVCIEFTDLLHVSF